MAELALGLSKSVVAGALTKVRSAIDDDSNLRQKVKRDLVSITMQLEMMQSFMDDVNKEMQNNLVSTWVKHIRLLGYDLEDWVENAVHLDDKPIFWRRLIPPCMLPQPLQLDEAVEEIEQLKFRVEDVNNCYRSYNLIGNGNGNGDDSASATAAMKKKQQQQQQSFDMLADARGATKRRKDFADLTRLIADKRSDANGGALQVISVWGAGDDHGITSIIRKTYNHTDICRSSTTYNRAWVKLMHPFSPQDFIRTLMTQFYTNSSSSQQRCVAKTTTKGLQVLTKMQATQGDLFYQFEQLVTKERYLIVLEGLSNMIDWDAVRTFLPDMENGSCIIVSTQQPEIAALCVGQFYQILELKRFSDDHSVCALFKASRNGDNKGKNSRDATFIGRDPQLKELGEYVAKARVNSPPVMSVWGIAGVGKSSLVRSLYEKRRLHSVNKYHDEYFWVDVSHPFNLRDLYLSLLPDIYSQKDPIEQCHSLLTKHRCLVVIDELRYTTEWDLMQAALEPKKSKSVIIVITTDKSIATYCTNNNEEFVFNAKALEAAAAFDLFHEVLKKKLLSYLMTEAGVEVQELILKCGGLPKVIAAIAELLAKVRRSKLAETVHSLNRGTFIHDLETGPEFGSLESVFRGMQSMVLNPPDFLKPCIFYLSIFPHGKIIRRRRLVRRWIAEGYSRQTSLERQQDENGERFFSELLDMSIFQSIPQLEGTRMVSYQVNGFIREYIASRQIEENLVFELGGSSAQRTGRHLIILEDWDRDRIVFDSMDFSRLRSLTVFGKWKPYFISESMKMIRVLDLEDASSDLNDDDVENIVEWLRRLKFLSLRGHGEVCQLPSSLGELRQLQTLDVRGTSIVTLPNSITKLHKLQYIRAGKTDAPSTSARSKWFRRCCRRRRVGGVEVPEGIGKFTALHTLGVVDVPASGGKLILKELKELTQLRKLGVSGINRKNIKKFVKSVHGAHLESLSLQLDKGNQGCLDDISLPWKNLQSLKLYGLQDKLPRWREHLSKLRKLDLEMATLEKNDNTEFLAKLPELCILCLRVKQLQDGKLHFYAEMYGEEVPTYEKVKILEISCSSSSVLHVTFGSEAMKNLELLKLDCSNLSSYHLTGLNYLSELKEVLLVGTNDEALKTGLEKQLLKHPKEPAVTVKLEQRN